MSVVSCKLLLDDAPYSVNEKFRESQVFNYHIVCNDAMDSGKMVLLGAETAQPHPLPRQYQFMQVGNAVDPFMRCRRRSLKRIRDTTSDWIATLEYDNELDPGQQSENPLEREPIDEWDVEQFQRVFEKDIEGNPILNPVGEPLPTSFDDSRPILTYSRNEASYPTQFLFYQDAINADQFLIFPPRTAKVQIRAQKRWENGIRYYAVKYVFHGRREGWEREVLNVGRKARWVAGGPTFNFIPGAKEALLNEDGTLASADNPSYTKIKGYKELPFAPLNIFIY